MKKKIIPFILAVAAVVLLGAGCGGQGYEPQLPQAIRIAETRYGYLYRIHDDASKVTCWIVTGEHGMSCIPDKDL